MNQSLTDSFSRNSILILAVKGDVQHSNTGLSSFYSCNLCGKLTSFDIATDNPPFVDAIPTKGNVYGI